MGIGDSGILTVNRDLKETVLTMVDELVADDSELISIYYGEEISEEDGSEIEKEISGKYPSCDVELQYGGQPIYYYIISVE